LTHEIEVCNFCTFDVVLHLHIVGTRSHPPTFSYSFVPLFPTPTTKMSVGVVFGVKVKTSPRRSKEWA